MNDEEKITVEQIKEILDDLSKTTFGKTHPVIVDQFKMIQAPLISMDEINKNGSLYPKDLLAMGVDVSKMYTSTSTGAVTGISTGGPTAGGTTTGAPTTGDFIDGQSIIGSEIYTDENGMMRMRIDHAIRRTLSELIIVLRAYVNVQDVQIVYDMAPDEVSIVISHREKTTKTQWEIVENIARIINGTYLTDYDQLEWTIRAKGVKKFDRNIQGSTGRDESQLQQSAGTEGYTAGPARFTEHYGGGVLSTSAIARAVTISTD